MCAAGRAQPSGADRRRLSRAGKFQIWTLSDLNGASVSLFVFKDAYGVHAKEPEGTVILLCTPRVLPAKDDRQAFSLTVSMSMEVVRIGGCRRL